MQMISRPSLPYARGQARSHLAARKLPGSRMGQTLACVLDAQSVETCFAGLSAVGVRYMLLDFVPDETRTLRGAVAAVWKIP